MSATAPEVAVGVRLHALRLNNFRGVRALTLDLQGRNAAIIGPNGTGKSSVADAVDFVLTGEIRRLTGEGAQAVSLAKHGRHVDAKPEDSWVEAELQVGTARHTVRRDLSRPEELVVTGPLPAAVGRALALAQGGHHLLTRREILRYVFTEPSRRGQQVAALLQLTPVDTMRKEIQGAAREAREMCDQHRAIRGTRERSLVQCFQPAAPDRESVLAGVNGARARLGASVLSALAAGEIRDGVAAPTAVATHPLAPPRAAALAAELTRWLDGDGTAFAAEAGAYLDDVEALRGDAETAKALRAADLIDRGLALLPEGGADVAGPSALDPPLVGECPLCLRDWDPVALRALLEARSTAAGDARARIASLGARRTALQRAATAVRTAARSLADLLLPPGVAPDAAYPHASAAARACRSLEADLGRAATTLLPDPLADARPGTGARATAVAACTRSDVRTALRAVVGEAAVQPAVSEAQRAWDALRSVEQALRECETAEAELAVATRVAEDLAAADRLFVTARDEVLDGTYGAIAGRLQELYRIVHGPDEAAFSATLAPTKAGLKLEVDFYGRGEHPPCALHSEGHQDSLGLCFFLTLTEYLASGPLPFVVLDDVLMSVDAGHRRAVADVLKREFPNCQFIITTHDRVWWRQLRSLGVVTGRGSFEFQGWTLEDGPVVHADAGALFRDVDIALGAGNVPSAAHALRRGVETLLPDVCDALGASVRFRSDGAWGAGEFLQAAIGRYGDVLGKARAAAQSWGDASTDWSAHDAAKTAAFQAYNAENWAVNANVHFNQWADFTASDFRPVVEAYKQLFSLLVCATCAVPLRVVEEGPSPTGLRCDCGRTNWNLQRRGK